MVLSSQQLVAAGRQLEAPFEVGIELSGELQAAVVLSC